MKNKRRTGAKKILDKSEQMERPEPKGPAPASSQGVYRMVYMVYAPENPSGRGVIQVELPNAKEYRRVRRQLWRKKATIRFRNAYGEPQLVHAASPNMISITVEKYVVKPEKKGEAPKVILPTQEAISQIN